MAEVATADFDHAPVAEWVDFGRTSPLEAEYRQGIRGRRRMPNLLHDHPCIDWTAAKAQLQNLP
jgi:hypothetical protein